MRRSEDIHQEIERLEEKRRIAITEGEKRRLQNEINFLEEEMYKTKQLEYIRYSVLDEPILKERLGWLEESKRQMRLERKKMIVLGTKQSVILVK